MEELVREYPEVLDSADKPIEFCKIETEEGKRIVRKEQKIPQALVEKTMKYLDDLERRGIIRRSTAEWRNPVRASPKPDGGIRFVSNITALNDLVKDDPYTMGDIREVIAATQGSRYFSVIDLKKRFYYIEIEEKDKHKTAFEVNGRLYEWNGMIMGYKNSPAIMRRVMDTMLGDLRGKGVEVYMDDIVIRAKSRPEHNKLLHEVLKRLKENKMRVNPKKLQLGKGSAFVLGATIDGINQYANEIKKNEALEYGAPKTVSELRRFLGLTGWFRKFIKDYAGRTLKMTEALKGKNKQFVWTDEMNKEFERMKIVLRDLKGLALPDYNRKFMLRTDACGTGMGAVLLQQDEKGEWVPVQWASKKFTATEQRYEITEMGMLAVYWGIKKFEYNLRGRKIILITDHKVLEQIRKKAYFENARVNRWIELIQEFDFEIHYNRGIDMVIPDALSRLYEKEASEENRKKRQEQERKRMNREKRIKEGKWNKHVEIVNGQERWKFDDGSMAIISEESARKGMVEKVHLELEHRGSGAVYYELKRNYYWPGMRETVKKCY